MKAMLTTFLVCFIAQILPAQDLTSKQWLDSGYVAYQKGNYEDAISKFQESIDLNNQNAEAFYLKGVCQSAIQLNIAALKTYDKALALKPDYAEVYYEKGYSYFQLNKYQKAIEQFDKAIELRPDYAEAWFNRGSVKCIVGEKEGALADWEQARKLGASIPNLECE